MRKEATIEEVEIDTFHYKGDFPEFAQIEFKNSRGEWQELIPKSELIGDKNHIFNEFTH